MNRQNINILGLMNTKVSGAAIISDSKIIAAVSEERFTRFKNDGSFPLQSINYVLKKSGLKIYQIDYVGVGCWKGIDSENYLHNFISDIVDSVKKNPASWSIINQRINVALKRDAYFKHSLLGEMQKLGFKKEKIFFYDHHAAHAYTSFYLSPFPSTLVFIFDGRGDFRSGTVWLGDRKNGLRLIDSTSMLNSLGVLYGFITNFLGFTPDKHEGKVMGLAAYGDYRKTSHIFKKMIYYQKGKIKSNIGTYYTPFVTGRAPQIEKELSNYKKEDVAAGVQYWLEKTAISYIRPFIKKFNPRYICLAGGVFENVKLNQKIRELPGVDNVYIFPHMGDGGMAVGGALLRLYEIGYQAHYPLASLYLGPEFSSQEIEAELKKFKNLYYSKVGKNKAIMAAEAINKGKIVGWFQGRMEYGPRALGARSILANATDNKITNILNGRLHRTEFMPFAPVTLVEKAKECYIGWKPSHLCSKFMTMCYTATPLCKKQTPGIVHVDNTVRPQIISREDNPEYYDVVKNYFNLTGIPSIINTSFNNHEEPIVCKPEDAILSLLRNSIDILFIGSFKVERI